MIDVQEALARGRRAPHAYRTSHALEELELVFDDGTRVELLVKHLGRDGLDGPARLAKPAFLHDPRRELDVYRRILASAGLGTARLYGANDEPHSILLLEKVPGVALWQVGEVEVWCDVARWLARMHERLAGSVGEAYLLRMDADWYRFWFARALERHADLEPLAARYDDVVERLAALPRTVVHGEFYPSNVLVDGARVCPVDWEMTGVGPGVLDLAALTSGWADDERATIVAAYGDVPEEALECARLHLAVQWLGWSPTWSPPPEHAHDWLGEALAAAERLGL